MEYLAGSFITILVLILSKHFIRKLSPAPKHYKMKISQSRTYDIIAPYVFPIRGRAEINTQSFNYIMKSQLRVLMKDNMAYWIKENAVYKAEMENGIIISDSAKVVDIMSMDKVELEEMIFIIGKLTEGKSNDSWNSGNQIL